LFDFAYIAEKPSLAEHIAAALGRIHGVTPQKANGVWTVGKDAVTWVRGHFFEQWMPQDYDPSLAIWRVENFPFWPDKWKLKLRQPKKGDRDPEFVPRQTAIIKQVIGKAKNIVNVGDPGREGQLLIDEFLEEAGYDPFAKNMWRLWPDDLTDAALEATVKARFPNAEKKNLFDAAVMRSRADWVHGLNLTGLYSALARNAGARIKSLPVGRVQTPVLKLVADRDREIEGFKPVRHYLPNIVFAHANGKFKATWIIPENCPGLNSNGQLIDKSVADAVVAKVLGKTGKIDAYSVTKKSKAPPLTWSLATLTKKCAALFSMTGDETLKIAQHLYDEKLTTYPRTESEHLRTEMFQEAPLVMSGLAGVQGLGDLVRGANLKIKTKVWDDAKSKEHYGIVPAKGFSAAAVSRLTPTQRAVFDLIAKNYIANFYPDQTWNSLSATVDVEREKFKATGRQPTSPGWRVVFGAVADDDDDDKDKETEQTVPPMAKNDPVKVESGTSPHKDTTPPSRWTDGTLIDAMTKIWLFVTEPEVKKRLNESGGLGTAATRAGMIEKLLASKLLARPEDLAMVNGKAKSKTKVKKSDAVVLISSNVGRSLVDALPRELTSPGLTALWEGQLSKVADGQYPAEKFYEALLNTVSKYCERAKNTPLKIEGATIEALPGDGEKCPNCGKGTMRTRMISKGDNKGKRFLSCDAYNKDDPNSCRHAVFPDSGPKKDVKPADGHGRTCPKCGKGQLITRKGKTGAIFLGCNNWVKDNKSLSCDYVEFPEEKIAALPGDGEKCEKCGIGRMRTRKFFKGDQKGERYLSCDGYNKDNPLSCRNAIFPDRKQSPSGKSGSGGSGASSPSAKRKSSR
jgi:DNA topoisomerase-3